MLKLIQTLEDKLATLLDFVHQLQEDNRQLRERVQQLEHDKRALQERMNTAQGRIDRVIERLSQETVPNPSDSIATTDTPEAS